MIRIYSEQDLQGLTALSIRQPWASLMFHSYGGNRLKDIENRTWTSPGYRPLREHRGPTAIHSSGTMTQYEYEVAMEFVNGLPDGPRLPPKDDNHFIHKCGQILGVVDIVDCVTESDSPWFTGKIGFVLADPFALMEPIPATGRLGFWPVSQPIIDNIARQAATFESYTKEFNK